MQYSPEKWRLNDQKPFCIERADKLEYYYFANSPNYLSFYLSHDYIAQQSLRNRFLDGVPLYLKPNQVGSSNIPEVHNKYRI